MSSKHCGNPLVVRNGWQGFGAGCVGFLFDSAGRNRSIIRKYKGRIHVTHIAEELLDEAGSIAPGPVAPDTYPDASFGGHHNSPDNMTSLLIFSEIENIEMLHGDVGERVFVFARSGGGGKKRLRCGKRKAWCL